MSQSSAEAGARGRESESAIFVSLVCSLLPEDLHSELILYTSI